MNTSKFKQGLIAQKEQKKSELLAMNSAMDKTMIQLVIALAPF